MNDPEKAAGGQLTQLLNEAKNGDEAAAGTVFEMLLKDMLQIARQMMTSERSGHTLQTTC